MQLLSAYSEVILCTTNNLIFVVFFMHCMLQYFPNILRIRPSNTFSIDVYLLSAYSQNTSKEWRICRNKCLLSTMPNEVKGTLFQENQMGVIKCPTLNNTNFKNWAKHVYFYRTFPLKGTTLYLYSRRRDIKM